MRSRSSRVVTAVAWLVLATGLTAGPSTAAEAGPGTPALGTTLGAVRALHVVLQRDQQVTVAWSRPAVGRPTAYRVKYRGKVLTVPRSVRRVTLAGLPDGLASTVTVRALRHSSAGVARTVSVMAAGRPVAPAAPVISVSDAASVRTVALSWSAVAANGPGPVEYQVLRDGALVACGWTTAAGCTHTEALDGQLHTFAVRARNAEETSPREVGTPGFHLSGWSTGRAEPPPPYGAIGTPAISVSPSNDYINGTASWNANGKPVNVVITRNGSPIWSTNGTGSGSHSFSDHVGWSSTGNYVVTVSDTALWPGQTSARASKSASASTTTPSVAPTVTVSKGASAVGQPGCTDPSCAFIVATTANFPGTVTCSVSATDHGTAGFITWTQGGTATKQSPDYFGWPNGWVEVTCGGVTSPRFYW